MADAPPKPLTFIGIHTGVRFAGKMMAGAQGSIRPQKGAFLSDQT